MQVTAIRNETEQTAVTGGIEPRVPDLSPRREEEHPALQRGPSLRAKASALNTNEGARLIWSDVAGDSPIRPTASQANQNAFRSDTPTPLEGYDQAKLDNPDHKTPKYIFGRVAQGYKLDSVQGDKGRAEELLRAMVPDLRAAGLEVVGVEGDRIQVKTEVGYEWVDVVRGAGTDRPGWWWGSEGKGTPRPTDTVQEWAAATGQTGAGAAGQSRSEAAATPPAATASAPNPNAGVLGRAIDEAAVMAILKKYPPTNEGIRQAMPELQMKFPGVKLLEHPKRLDKLQFPNGAVIDVIVGAGGNEPKWGWIMEN